MQSQKNPISRFNILSHHTLPFNYIYCPKNACSTIKASLIGQKVNPHQIAQDLYGGNQVDPAKPFFLITRNPFTRFRSAFLDKISPGRDPLVWSAICNRYNLDSHCSIRPSELLGYFIEDENPHEIEPHFRPQYILHNYSYLKPAVTARFENFLSITSFLSGYGLKAIRWDVHSRSSIIDSFEFTEDLISKICDFYSNDFIFYGYATEPVHLAISTMHLNQHCHYLRQNQKSNDEFRNYCENQTGLFA